MSAQRGRRLSRSRRSMHQVASQGGGVERTTSVGVLADLAAGTIFAWSLVAGPAVADVGASTGTAAAVSVFTVTLLGVGRGLRRLGPRRLLVVAAAGAGAGLGTAVSWDRPVA